MSRRSRHRPSEPRRAVPPAAVDGSQRVQLAAVESAPVEASRAPVEPSRAPVDPGRAPDAPAAMPMVSVQLPTATTPVGDDPAGPAGCTPAQLRRFIKSRAYLPVHEIRRRFGIETADDDVTGFQLETGRIFVGLPQREGRILGDLVRAGEVGYELQLDPEAPIIVGVYPMRPVTRQ